jgi:hypothetical protein
MPWIRRINITICDGLQLLLGELGDGEVLTGMVRPLAP